MVDIRTRPNPPPPSPYRRSAGPLIALVALAVIGVGAVVFLVANAGDDAPPAELATTPSALPTTGPTTTLDPDAATKAEIIEAYRQSWDVFVAIGSDPNADFLDPRLEEYMGGDALVAAQLSLRERKSEGHAYEGSVEVHPEVVELTATTAVVRDCGLDQLSLVDVETGEVLIPPGPVEGTLGTATYRLVDGRWLQVGFTDEKQSCPLPGRP